MEHIDLIDAFFEKTTSNEALLKRRCFEAVIYKDKFKTIHIRKKSWKETFNQSTQDAISSLKRWFDANEVHKKAIKEPKDKIVVNFIESLSEDEQKIFDNRKNVPDGIKGVADHRKHKVNGLFILEEINDAEKWFVFLTKDKTPSTIWYTGPTFDISYWAPGDWNGKTKSLWPDDESVEEFLGWAKK